VRPTRHRVYGTARWHTFRRYYLARHPLCVFCERVGRLRASREVHHLTKLADGGDVFDESNCRALCSSCHAKETAAGR